MYTLIMDVFAHETAFKNFITFDKSSNSQTGDVSTQK